MLDYYPEFTGLSDTAIRVAEAHEQAAIDRADLIVYPSSWAADSAVRDYGADPAKVHVVPYGANLTGVPDHDRALRPRAGPSFTLLFIGVNWQRKGGAIAVETLRALQARGLACRLVVCGCVPPLGTDLSDVEVVPFLDKNDPGQRGRLSQLYEDADLFILPTRSECLGIVFCEAAAFGLPAFATRTGGIPDVVREGVNGYSLPPQARGADWATAIAPVLNDPARYAALRAQSRALFEADLNWDTWGRRTSRLMQGLLRVRTRKPA
jgi:glycosyltransferase involved in cell wall biosynthesis